MAVNLNHTAKESHGLAARIAAARNNGDHETAEILIKEFNQRIFANQNNQNNSNNQTNKAGQPAVNNPAASSGGNNQPIEVNQPNQPKTIKPSSPLSAIANHDIEAQLANLEAQYQQLLHKKQHKPDPTNSVPSVSANQPSSGAGKSVEQSDQIKESNINHPGPEIPVPQPVKPNQPKDQPAGDSELGPTQFRTLAEAVSAANAGSIKNNPGQQNTSGQITMAGQSNDNSHTSVPENLPIVDSNTADKSSLPQNSIDTQILQSLSVGDDSTIGTHAASANQSESSNPASRADVKTLLSNYHEGVQILLKEYLKNFSEQLETPEAILAPILVQEFEDLWRQRQQAEPLLLKLPEHIQQRSVLLRFKDELESRLD
jgi:hypothetical protein